MDQLLHLPNEILVYEICSHLSFNDISCLFSTCKSTARRLACLRIKYSTHHQINKDNPVVPDIFDSKERFRDCRGNYIIIKRALEKATFHIVSILFVSYYIEDKDKDTESRFTLHIPDILVSLHILKASTSLGSHTPRISIAGVSSLQQLCLRANVNIELPNSLVTLRTCFIDNYHSLPPGIRNLTLRCSPRCSSCRIKKDIIYPDSLYSLKLKNIALTEEDIERIPKHVKMLYLVNIQLGTLRIPPNIEQIYLNTEFPVRIINLPESLKHILIEGRKLITFTRNQENREMKIETNTHPSRIFKLGSFKELYISNLYIELTQLAADESSDKDHGKAYDSLSNVKADALDSSFHSFHSLETGKTSCKIVVFSNKGTPENKVSSILKEIIFHDNSISPYDDKVEKLSIDISKYMIIRYLPKNLKKLTLRNGKFDIQCQYPSSLDKLKIYRVIDIRYSYDLPEGLKTLKLYGYSTDELAFVRSINGNRFKLPLSLEELGISSSNIKDVTLPPRLKKLYIWLCDKLEEIVILPESLEELIIKEEREIITLRGKFERMFSKLLK